jgi:hypothetical protein
MPPRSTAAPFLGLTVAVLVAVVVAWQLRASYLPELDQIVNEVAVRYNLVPTS